MVVEKTGGPVRPEEKGPCGTEVGFGYKFAGRRDCWQVWFCGGAVSHEVERCLQRASTTLSRCSSGSCDAEAGEMSSPLILQTSFGLNARAREKHCCPFRASMGSSSSARNFRL